MDHNNSKETANSLTCKGQKLEQTVDCSINNFVMDDNSSLIHVNRNESSQNKIQNLQISNILMKHNSDDISFSQKQKIQKILKDIQNYVDIENSFENRLQNLLNRVEKLNYPQKKIELSTIVDLKQKAQIIYQKKVKQQQLLKKIFEKKQRTLEQKQKQRKERIQTQPSLQNINKIQYKVGANQLTDSQFDQCKNQTSDIITISSPSGDVKNQERPIIKKQFQKDQKANTATTIQVSSQNFTTLHRQQNGCINLSKKNEKSNSQNNSEIHKIQKNPSVQIKQEKKSVSSPRGPQIQKMSAETKEVKQKQEIKNKNKKPKGNRKKK